MSNPVLRLYQFHFIDGRGVTPVMDLAEYPDDDAAVRSATTRLDEHASGCMLEIYQGQRLVLQMRRDTIPDPI
jgi:demethoxyubiquinone hydroxylase (CLK1/Coq7/Cat5 family)